MTPEYSQKSECKDKPEKKDGRKVTYSPELLEKIDNLAKDNHKTGTIAVALGLDEQTLERKCGIRMRQKRVEGKIELKRKQIEKAKAGDVTMLIWMGKNDLEQTDKQEISGNDEKPLRIVEHLESDK